MFLAERPEPLEDALRWLTAAEVHGFVVVQRGPGGRSGSAAKILTGGLRSLLRYLHLLAYKVLTFASTDWTEIQMRQLLLRAFRNEVARLQRAKSLGLGPPSFSRRQLRCSRGEMSALGH